MVRLYSSQAVMQEPGAGRVLPARRPLSAPDHAEAAACRPAQLCSGLPTFLATQTFSPLSTPGWRARAPSPDDQRDERAHLDQPRACAQLPAPYRWCVSHVHPVST